MKLSLMERAYRIEGDHPLERGKRFIVIGVVLAIHLIFFLILSYVPQTPLGLPKNPIPITLVFSEAPLEAVPKTQDIPVATSRPTPVSKPIVPKQPPSPEPNHTPQPESPIVEIISEPSALPKTTETEQAEISQQGPTGNPIPDRWRLPTGARIPLGDTNQAINPNLKALSTALDCLGFDADCALQRKIIFAEDQLTETDLVWMRSYAHSGLSNADLYGLSEAEIRERLGIPTAGKNGFMLLPGLAIDGPWWDALHGVNKGCKYSVAIGDNGSELRKSCPKLKPSSKDRIGFIPKPPE